MTVSPYEPQPSGEIVQYQPGSSVAALREWAEAARAAYAVAQSLVKTSFVPVEYRGKPEEATAAILAGNEVGLNPIASLNAYSVIQGRAAANALTLRAICQSRGHEFALVESTASRCVMRCRRAGEDEWQSVTWTFDRARQLGLTGRKQWREQPQNMLVARATSEAARLVGADAILGIPYSAEELRDQATETAAQNGAAPRARRRTAVAPTVPTTAAEPPVQAGPPPLPGEPGFESGGESEPDVETVERQEPPTVEEFKGGAVFGPRGFGNPETEVSAAEMVTEPAPSEADAPLVEPPGSTGPPEPPRMRLLFKKLRAADVGDRHQYATGVLKRDVTTFSTLTADEVEVLISNLEAITQDDATEET